MSTGTDSAFLYEQLAALLAGQIESGVLPPGSRLPSVRHLARSRNVSLQTAIEAYRRLEDRGWVEARERSGFFVVRPPSPAPAPRPERPPAAPREVTSADRILEVMAAVHRPGVLSLGAAYPDPSLLPVAALGRALTAAVREAGAEAASALDFRGFAPLRQALARRAFRAGLSLTADDLVITAGASEALALALAVVTRPGDTVAVESPAYFGLLQLLAERGLRVLEIATDAQTGIDLEALAAGLSRHRVAALVVVPSFQNPLGARMPEAKRRELVALAASHDLPVVEDELFGELAFDGSHATSLSVFDSEGRVLGVGSFSKMVAPGFRVGWLRPGRYRDAVLRRKAASSAVSMPAQMALARFLASGGMETHLQRLRRTVSATVFQMRQAVLARFPAETGVSDPRGGFLLWVELPPGGDAVGLHRRALAAGISIAPGPIFSAEGAFGHAFRLNAAHPWSPRLAGAIENLAALVR